MPWRGVAVLAAVAACSSCAHGPLRGLPKLLRAAREIQCGDEETARDAAARLREAPLGKGGLPNEQLSSRKGTLTTGSLDLVLDALADGAQRFPQLRREIEGVAIGWSYCRVDGLGVGPSPVHGRGLRRWGLLPGTPEERFVPDLLINPALGGGHDALFIRAVERDRCVRLPWAGDDQVRVALAAPAGESKLAWGPTCPLLPPHPPRIVKTEKIDEFTVSTVASSVNAPPPLPFFAGSRHPIGFVGNVYLSQKLTATAPAVGVTIAYYPFSFLFVRTGFELAPSALPGGGAINAFTYTWGLGYDDPHPGTFSAQINHWTPLRFNQVLDLPGAELDLGYKIPYPLRMARFFATSVHVNIPFNATPALDVNVTFKPYGGLFVLAGIRFAPFEKDRVTIYYGLGLFNWRPFNLSVAYYNWGRNPITSPGFVTNGAIVGSFSWSF